jgi:hypothetical protein
MRTWPIILLAACTNPMKEQESLTDTVRAFNENVRWERFDRAAARLPPKERAARVDEWDERAKDVKITEWELVKIDPRGDRAARAQIKLSWYRESEQILKQTQEVQTWERHGKVWLLVDESHLRGAELPGISERGTDPK